MPLRAQCPAGHKLIVPDDRAGRTLRCPRCQAEFVAPGERCLTSVVGSPQSDAQTRMAVVEQAAAVNVELTATSREILDEPVKPKSRPRVQSPTPPSAPTTAIEPPPQIAELPAASALPEASVPEMTTEDIEPCAAPPPPVDFRPPMAEEATEAEAPIGGPAAAPFETPAEFAPAAPSAITPDRHWLPAAYGLAAGLVAAALFGIVPAVWDVVDYVRYYDETAAPHVARWALLLLLLGAVQAAYALYVFQLPDWTSVWVVTLYALALAGLYALLLGLLLISREDGLLIGPGGLQLADKLAGGKAALWCLAMTCVWIMLAFFAGRLSLQWRRAELVLRSAGIQAG